MHDISFNIKKNKILGILGPSGSGKSTFFKMLTMAISRSSGSIEILGQDFDNE